MARTQQNNQKMGRTLWTRCIFPCIGAAFVTMTSTALTDTASAAEPIARIQPAPPKAQVTVEKVAYEGWNDAYRITNGTAEVVIVPHVARIMRYGFVNGANLLWNNPNELGKDGDAKGWRNFGGDKAWPWSQDDWGTWFKNGQNWPPPPEVEQVPQTAEVIGANTVRLTSPLVAKTGLRVVREITLAETGTRLYIITRLERVEDGYDFPVGAWTITQTPFVDGPLIAHLLPGETTLAEGWRIMGDKSLPKSVRRSADGVTLTVERDPDAKSGRKLGFDGDAMAGRFGNTVLMIHAESPDAPGAVWSPGERGQMYISDAGTPYMEWEFTSPRKPIKRGESVTLITTLEARQIPADRNTNESLDAALRGKL